MSFNGHEPNEVRYGAVVLPDATRDPLTRWEQLEKERQEMRSRLEKHLNDLRSKRLKLDSDIRKVESILRGDMPEEAKP